MRTVFLTPQEYINFKRIVKTKFDALYSKGMIAVTCEDSCLKLIGF